MKQILFILMFLAQLPVIFGEGLVPGTPNTAPDYFCTWNLQGYVTSFVDPSTQADAMIEQNLFGKGKLQSWVSFYPRIREDLILVLDDTWDIPLGGGRSHPMRGSMELDSERFPSFQGNPAERLAALNQQVRNYGWRGLGLWVCSARAKARRDITINDYDYWVERMQWSQAAGIDYWKVDWGAMGVMDIWRLNQWANRASSKLWIEHGGLDRSGSRMWLPDKIDIFRTYDINIRVSIPETIRRISQVLRYPRQGQTARGLINCEDEVYIGAALGCTYGIMRHPLVGDMPNGEPDRVFPADFRDMKRRMDEVVRAVRWHRIAQPFGTGDAAVIDTVELRDSEKGAAAPARIARGGLSLPTVSVPDGQPVPYVLCSRYLDGEIAIATIGRAIGRDVAIPRADVTLDAGTLDRPVGVFGEYASLTLIAAGSLTGKRILAQDLAGNEPVDITNEVKISDGRLTIPGSLIHRVGLMAAEPGDQSDPGLVLAIDGLTRYVPKPAMRPAAPSDSSRPAVDPQAGLKVTRALWGPVYGGMDVTDQVAGRVVADGLTADASVETLGDDGSSDPYKRLELEYTCGGRMAVVLALIGERVIVDAQGNYRTERIGRVPYR